MHHLNHPIHLSSKPPEGHQDLSYDEPDGGPNLPPPCDEEIYKNGRVVVILPGNLRPWKMEEAVIRASARAGYKMDWYISAGRHVVKTLGDAGACYVALMAMLESHTDSR